MKWIGLLVVCIFALGFIVVLLLRSRTRSSDQSPAPEAPVSLPGESGFATSFIVTDMEFRDSGLFLVLPPDIHAYAGMKIRKGANCEQSKELLITAIVGPPELPPALLLPRATRHDFKQGEEVHLTLGNDAEGDLLLQALDTWVFAERKGVVVTGTARGTIAANQELVLRSESGEKHSCKCVGIERFHDGSGKPTQPGEEGVSILLVFEADFGNNLFDYSKPDQIIRNLGKFPSLHARTSETTK